MCRGVYLIPKQSTYLCNLYRSATIAVLTLWNVFQESDAINQNPNMSVQCKIQYILPLLPENRNLCTYICLETPLLATNLLNKSNMCVCFLKKSFTS